VDGHEIPDGWFGMDIGPKTIAMYGDIIKTAGTVVWNGPMASSRTPRSASDQGVAQALRRRSDHGGWRR